MVKGLTGNQLKLIAMLTMTVDHIGHILFPNVLWLRLIGRLAMPIYAYFIAEGCRYTRSMPKYLASIAVTALLCQIVTFLAGSLYQCILVTFSMSVGLIALLKQARKSGSLLWWLLLAAAITAVWFVTQTLPELLPDTDYHVDYSFWGVLMPVILWLIPNKPLKLLAAAAVLFLINGANILYLCTLGAVALLALYNGQRGTANLKWLFYGYYPLHLAVLHLIAMLI